MMNSESHQRETTDTRNLNELLAWLEYGDTSGYRAARCSKEQEKHWADLLRKLIVDRPRKVYLCGSTRFMQVFIDAQRSETLAGNIVLSVGLFGHGEGIDMNGPVKAMLDELHLRKIDDADEVLVLNCKTLVCPDCSRPCVTDEWRPDRSWSMCCGVTAQIRPYIGESTRREIAYAEANGKRVRYLETPP